MKSRENTSLHSTKDKMSIARQIVCSKYTVRHPPKVGYADSMVELGRNTYQKYRLKVSLNDRYIPQSTERAIPVKLSSA